MGRHGHGEIGGRAGERGWGEPVRDAAERARACGVLALRPIPPEYRFQWLGLVPWVVW